MKKDLFFENGKLYYSGEMLHNMKHGYGRKYNINSYLEYEGFFKNDEYSGKGKLFIQIKNYYLKENF